MNNHKGESKRRFGPSGSQINPDYWAYNLQLKIGPARIPADELDAETFKEMLAEQEKQGREAANLRQAKATAPMTKDQFFEIYNNPNAPERRRQLSAKERMLTGLEYFQRIDERFWENEQMTILRTYIDKKRKEEDDEAYELWTTLYLKRVQKAHKKVLAKYGQDKARDFLEYSWTYMNEQKPADIQPFTKIIRDRIRVLTLQQNKEALEALTEELHMIISKKLETKPKLQKRKRRKKSNKNLPPGKTPYEAPNK